MDHYEHMDHWRRYLATHGTEALEEQASKLPSGTSNYPDIVLREHVRKQKLTMPLRQENRENEILEVAKEANRIARKANLYGLSAIGISIVALFVAVLLALAEKQA